MVKLTDKKDRAVVSGVRRHRWWFDTAYAFAEWYNNRGHEALDLDYFETQNVALVRKMSSENTLGMFFEWSEKEVSL